MLALLEKQQDPFKQEVDDIFFLQKHNNDFTCVMDRSYQPTKPASSKLLQKRWDDMSYRKHIRQLEECKSNIDNGSPPRYFNRKNSRKSMSTQQRNLQICQENFRLLDRMDQIMNNRKSLGKETQCVSIRPAMRTTISKQVQKENLDLLAKLCSQKSTYDREKCGRDWEKSREHVKNISMFPRPKK